MQIKVESTTFKPDNLSFAEKFFLLFLNRLPKEYLVNGITIPFVVAEITLTNHRICKNDVRKILKDF